MSDFISENHLITKEAIRYASLHGGYFSIVVIPPEVQLLYGKAICDAYSKLAEKECGVFALCEGVFEHTSEEALALLDLFVSYFFSKKMEEATKKEKIAFVDQFKKHPFTVGIFCHFKDLQQARMHYCEEADFYSKLIISHVKTAFEEVVTLCKENGLESLYQLPDLDRKKTLVVSPEKKFILGSSRKVLMNTYLLMALEMFLFLEGGELKKKNHLRELKLERVRELRERTFVTLADEWGISKEEMRNDVFGYLQAGRDVFTKFMMEACRSLEN